ncbi:uncharacterized protein Bfra_012081 [Botrytis fragariae]|uniref:Uncharacterized protein n=1 Tax=Botrytis fragariae TaxID=1964551 RepID=A0A8H6AK62_9HELO|nr:uncharacterized protein Bfra_012081 [Botrytis fragariae]KAF5868750.1 hypothetical protein Bfra_012081 [Botrytis fragariae]
MQFSRISALALVVVLADFSIALPVSKGSSIDALGQIVPANTSGLLRRHEGNPGYEAAQAGEGPLAPAHPTEVHPAPVQPVVIHPTPVHPAAVHPTPVHPGTVQPADAQPAGVQPADVQPADVQPANIQQTGFHPVINNPEQVQGDREGNSLIDVNNQLLLPIDIDCVGIAVCNPVTVNREGSTSA